MHDQGYGFLVTCESHEQILGVIVDAEGLNRNNTGTTRSKVLVYERILGCKTES